MYNPSRKKIFLDVKTFPNPDFKEIVRFKERIRLHLKNGYSVEGSLIRNKEDGSYFQKLYKYDDGKKNNYSY